MRTLRKKENGGKKWKKGIVFAVLIIWPQRKSRI